MCSDQKQREKNNQNNNNNNKKQRTTNKHQTKQNKKRYETKTNKTKKDKACKHNFQQFPKALLIGERKDENTPFFRSMSGTIKRWGKNKTNRIYDNEQNQEEFGR